MNIGFQQHPQQPVDIRTAWMEEQQQKHKMSDPFW